MLRNLQQVEKRVMREDGALEVVGRPWLTIQGEGPLAGMPAVFVRLAGCSLLCPGCDTDYTTGRRLVPFTDLWGEVKAVCGGSFPLVVLTGGEPFRQNLLPFIQAMAPNSCTKLQIETNGTLYQPLPYWEEVVVVCSPKTERIAEGLLGRVNAFKYILREGEVDSEDGLPTSSLHYGQRPFRLPQPGPEVFVQPMDEQDPEKNRRNTQAAVRSCLKFGYRLCLQLHKINGVDLP